MVPDSGGATGVLAAATPTGITYGGGPLISSVSIHMIFLQDSFTGSEISAAERTQFHSYFSTITSDGFIPTLLTEYNAGPYVLGNGSIGPDDIALATPDTTVTNNATFGTDPSITDGNIQTIVTNEIAAGHTGAASGGANNIYFVFTPPGDATGDDFSGNSVNDFLGYHSSIPDPASPSGLDYYAVIPDQSFTPLGGQAGEFNANSTINGLNGFQGMTQAASHELVETITDANTTNGWIDPSNSSDGGEVGDHAANQTYVQDGFNVQYMWSNTLDSPAHAPSTGANDLFINQVSPPAVTGVGSVPVATFTSANTSLTASQFHVAVQDGTSPYPFWTSPTVTGSNGHFVINATPAAGTDTIGAHGTAFAQDGLYVFVSTSPLDFTNGAPSNQPISVRYVPYVVAASAPLNYTADSGSGTNNFVLKEVGSNFQLTDNGLIVFTQPIAQTTSININADPAVAGDPTAKVDDSLTIDYSGGVFTNAVNFNGGPGSAAHTLTITGATFPSETYAYTGPQSGTITIGSQTITYSHVTANANTTTVANLTINLPAAAQATLQDDGTPGNGISEIASSGSTFPVTTFPSPTTSLTIAAAGSSSQILLKTMDAGFHPPTEVFSSTSSGDVFQFVNAGAVASTTSVTLTTAKLDLNGTSPTIDALNGTGTITNSASASATLTVGAGGSSGVFNGTIQNGIGAVALTKTGSGTETLGSPNSYTGATTITAGTLADGTANAVPTNTSLVDNGTFDLAGFAQQVANVTGSGVVTDSGASANFTVANGSADTFAGTITGSTNLVAAGTGLLTLAGASTFNGTTAINASASVADGIANALPITTSLTVAGTLDLAGFAQQVGSVTGAGAVTDSGAAASFKIANASADTFAGTITGSTNLVAAGTAALTLTGASTFTGTTTINTGATLADGIANALPIGTSLSDGGTLNLGGFAQQVASVTGSGIVTDSGAAAIFTVNNASADTFAGALTGSVALTKTATGTLTLTGASNATGATIVSAGVLQVTGSIASNVTVANAATLDGAGATGTVTVQNGGILYPSTTVNTLSTSSLNLQAGAVYNVAFASSSSYSKDLVTSGTVTLATTGAGVTLNLASLAGFHPAGGDQYLIVDNSGGSAQTVAGTFLAGAGIDAVSAGTALAEGTVLSTNFLGSGFVATITYQGGANHKSVAIKVVNSSPLSYTGTSATNPNNFLLVQAGVNLDLYDNSVLVVQQAIQTTTSINIGVAAGLDATLTIDYSGGEFTNAVTFDGGTGNIIPHTVTLENGAFTNETYTYTDATTTTINLDDRVINTTHASSIADSLTIVNLTFDLPTAAHAELQDNGPANDGWSQFAPLDGSFASTTISNHPTSSLTIHAAGGSSLVELATMDSAFAPTSETFAGLAGDTFQFINGNAVSSQTSVTLTTATLDLNGQNPAIDGLAGNGPITDTNANASTLTIGSNGGGGTFAGLIQDGNGSVGLTKTGAGSETFTAANIYSGATTISAGTIVDGVANALPTSTALTANGTLNMAGFAQQVGSVSGTGIITDSGATANFTITNSASDTFAGTITGAINLVAAGSAPLTLTGANSFAGTTTVNSGATLVDGVTNALPIGTSLSVSGNFDLAAFSQQVTALTGGGIVTNSNATAAMLTINDASADLFAGVLMGNLGLTKMGAGTLTLPNTNTYAGPTSVSAGTLQVDGSITSDVALSSLATLDGSGTTGAVAGSGTLAPGDAGAPGTINTNSLGLTAGASFNVAIGGSSNVSQDNVAAGTVNLSTSGAGVKLNLSDFAGYQPHAGDIFLIVNNSAASAQPVAGLFTAGAGIDNAAAGTALTEGMDLSDNFLGSGEQAIITYQAGPNQNSIAIEIFGTLNYNGGPGSHNFLLVQNGPNLNLYDNTFITPVASAPLALTNSVRINVGQNNDATLTIDYSGGQFAKPVTFDGGAGTANHTLTIKNATFDTETFTYANSGAGSLNLDSQPVVFSDLTASNSTASILDNNVAVANVVFQLPSAAQATLQDDGGANNGLSELARTSGAVESTIFANPSNSLTIDSAGGTIVQLAATDAGDHPVAETLSGHANDTFRLANAAAIPGTTDVTITGASLDLHGLSPIIDALAGNGTITNNGLTPATLTIGNNNGGATFSGVIADGAATVALIKKGTGTETLAGNSTYSGGTAINMGTLADGIANALPTIRTLTLGNAACSGTLDLNGYSQTVASIVTSGTGTSNTVTDSGAAATFTVANSAADTFAGILAGTLGLTKSGAGTLTLSNANAYSGSTTILTGTLRDGRADALPTSTALSVTGSLDLFGFAQTLAGIVGSGTVTNSSTTSATFTVANSGADSFAGTLTGHLALTAQGPGVLTLAKANTFTGATRIAAGATLADGVANALPIGTALCVLGTFDLSGFNQQVGSVTGTGIVTNSSPASATFTINNAAADAFVGTLTGNLALTKSAAGLLTLASANFYTGATLIAAGPLQVGIANAIPGSSDVTVKGSLDLHGLGTTLGSLSGTGTVTSSAAGAVTLTVGANNNNASFSGVIQNGAGVVSLVKLGSGAETLAGANTFGGDTTLTAGILTINGTLYSNSFGVVNLSSAGVTLNGTGTIRGHVSLAASTSQQITHIDGVKVTVSTGGTGITVCASAAFAQIGLVKGVTVQGGNATSTGVLVLGSAMIFNSNISGHHIDVNVNGGSTVLQGNTLNAGLGAYATGLEAQNGAVVDAGQLAADTGSYGDITGLFSGTIQGSTAHSTGNNVFNGYTANTLTTNPAVAQAIRDLNTGAAPFGNLVYGGGPQLGRMDLTARNNIFNGVTNLPNPRIQQLVFDEREDHADGFVLFGLPQLTVSQTAPPSYLAPGATHPSTIAYHNADVSPSRAVIRVYLSGNMTLNLSLNPGWVHDGSFYAYDLGILPAGSSGTIPFNPSVIAGPTTAAISITVAITFDQSSSINLSATTTRSATSLGRVR